MLTRSPIVVAAVAVAFALVTVACDDGGHRNAWCRVVARNQSAFDTTEPLDKRALEKFAEVEAQAPDEIQADVRAVREGAVAFYTSDEEFRTDPQRVQAFVDAINRVDRYLVRECGADIPPREGASS